MKSSAIKLIVSDMDGTLLDEEKRLDCGIASVVEQLKRKGILFTVATGRNKEIVSSYIDELKIAIPYVADNGATLCLKHEIIESRRLNEAALDILTDRLIKENIPFILFDRNFGYPFGRSAKLDEIRQYFHGTLPMKPFAPSVLKSGGFAYKLTLDSVKATDMASLAKELSDRLPKITLRRSEGTLYTATAEGTSKGSALKQIAASLHIPLSQVLCFGDNYNDLSMFEVSGISVAMGNSDPEIRRQADDVAPSNQENGVSAYLTEKFNLNHS